MLDFANRTAREHKEQAVTRLSREFPGDIAPMVFFERKAELVAVAVAQNIDRDEGLAIATIGIAGFAADAVVWVADTHYSHSPINPSTGKKWGPNEMQHGCDHEGACDLGVIQDAIMLVRMGRNLPSSSMTTHPYDVDKTKRVVRWHASTVYDTLEGEASGLIPDTLSSAFAAPTMRSVLIAKNTLPIGLPEHQQRGVDALTARFLTTVGAVVVPYPAALSATLDHIGRYDPER